MTIDATQALALARTASGTLATVTLVDRLRGPIYCTERAPPPRVEPMMCSTRLAPDG